MGYVQILAVWFALIGVSLAEETMTTEVSNYTLNELQSCSYEDLNNLEKVVMVMQERLDEIQEQHDVMQERLNGLEDRLKNTTCEEIWKSGVTESGVYPIYPFHDRSKSLDVYCDFTIDLPGWITFQRRIDGSENFYRYWDDYVSGFGHLNAEFWMGLETLHQLTLEREYELRVDMEDFEGQTRYAKYSTFKVGEGDDYTLHVNGYSGNAGDSITRNNGMKFTTRNKDQDKSGDNCASLYQGAWWYDACHLTNPNGLYLGGSHHSYADGIEWSKWHGFYYSLKRIELKIRIK